MEPVVDYDTMTVSMTIDGKLYWARFKPKQKDDILDAFSDSSVHVDSLFRGVYSEHICIWWSPDAGRGFEMFLYPKGFSQDTYYSFKYTYTHDFMDPQYRIKNR